jgi:hypothetical protein
VCAIAASRDDTSAKLVASDCTSMSDGNPKRDSFQSTYDLSTWFNSCCRSCASCRTCCTAASHAASSAAVCSPAQFQVRSLAIPAICHFATTLLATQRWSCRQQQVSFATAGECCSTGLILQLTVQVKNASSEAFRASIYANDVLFRHVHRPATVGDQAMLKLVRLRC